LISILVGTLSQSSVSDAKGELQVRKLQLVLVAGIASALTALATVVGFADAQSQVIPANTENPTIVGTAHRPGRSAARGQGR
jgi:hypothetical protein